MHTLSESESKMRKELYLLMLNLLGCCTLNLVKKRGLPDGAVVNKCPESWSDNKCSCDISELTLTVTINCHDIASEQELMETFDHHWSNTRFEWFTLSNSIIESLSNETLKNLSFVGLIFTNVTLTNVSSDAFIGSAMSAEYIWVTDSNLMDFNFESLRSLKNLRSVAIMNSGLTKIPTKGFGDFHQLEVINLERNNINEIGLMAFSQLPRLQRLEFTGNNLSSLQYGVLNTTTTTYDVIVILVDNNIEKVLPGAFVGLKSNNIHLENNKLNLLKQDIFEPLLDDMMHHGGGKLYVTENPILCDDSIKWLLTKPKNYQEQIFGLDCPS